MEKGSCLVHFAQDSGDDITFSLEASSCGDKFRFTELDRAEITPSALDSSIELFVTFILQIVLKNIM